jgi:hypothetical protein
MSIEGSRYALIPRHSSFAHAVPGTALVTKTVRRFQRIAAIRQAHLLL